MLEKRTNIESKHLLVIRLSAMGDVAMCVPSLKALRKANPKLKITILTRSLFLPFFRDVENISFITPDFKGKYKGIKGLFLLASELRNLNITHIADLHNVLRTKFLRTILAFDGARSVAIDKARDAKNKMTRKFRKVLLPLRHTVDRHCDVFRALGFVFNDPKAVKNKHLAIPSVVSEFANLPSKKGKQKWIGVSPFAQHKGKIYPANQMAQLIEILSKEYDKIFIFGGGAYEQEFSEYMESKYENVFSIIGKIRINEELDLISNLDVMISMDSSAMHISSLVGTKVVSIWGATHPYAGFLGFGQSETNAVQINLSCRPCSIYGNKECQFKDYRCLSKISPQSIAKTVAKVVK